MRNTPDKTEDDSMENDKIKAIIDKWHLERRGEMVGTSRTHGIDKAAFMREVGAYKIEILDYFKAQEKAAADMRTKREAAFNAIPGVVALRKGRRQFADWQDAIERMVASGDGYMPHIDHPTAAKLKAMEAQYPMAVFALEAEQRAIYTENYKLASIWKATYDALCEGQNPKAVKALHDSKMEDFTNSIAWN